MTRRIGAVSIVMLLLAAGAGSAQTPRTGRLMREKLMHAQRILTAVTTSDYGLLTRETEALTRVTENPIWKELMTSELLPYTSGFTKALADLTDAASRRDLDRAAADYGTLTMACFQCHKHVMNSRIARR